MLLLADLPRADEPAGWAKLHDTLHSRCESDDSKAADPVATLTVPAHTGCRLPTSPCTDSGCHMVVAEMSETAIMRTVSSA